MRYLISRTLGDSRTHHAVSRGRAPPRSSSQIHAVANAVTYDSRGSGAGASAVFRPHGLNSSRQLLVLASAPRRTLVSGGVGPAGRRGHMPRLPHGQVVTVEALREAQQDTARRAPRSALAFAAVAPLQFEDSDPRRYRNCGSSSSRAAIPFRAWLVGILAARHAGRRFSRSTPTY